MEQHQCWHTSRAGSDITVAGYHDPQACRIHLGTGSIRTRRV